METRKIVIVGGGMVAGYAAQEMVARGLQPGSLCILSTDDSLPYERPPLSKGFLAGKDTEAGILINPPGFYKDHGIEVRLRTRVTGVAGGEHRLQLGDGAGAAALGFEKLVLATGAAARKLEVEGGELGGVVYLRSLDDARGLRQRARRGGRAVVIGGGFIGMETTAVLTQLGMAVTQVVREDRIWKAMFTPAMSRFFETYYTARGVSLVCNAGVARIEGDTSVSAVRMASGESLPCELVVAGVGASPATDFLAGSGLEINHGVVVNEYLETRLAGIYAAGDVANFTDLWSGRQNRIEHWDNAVTQGQHLARTLLGERAALTHAPYFFSDVFDLSYEYWGESAGADTVVERGDPQSNSFSVWWLRGGIVAAAFVMNRPDAERAAALAWVTEHKTVDAARLRAETPLTA